MSNIKQVGTISLDELLEEDSKLPEVYVDDTHKNRIDPDIDIKQAKKDNKYYLPVLYINDPTMWDSKPKSERRHFTDNVAMETCMSNCCGIPGVKNVCCQLDPDDLEHVLGPLDEKWIKKTIKWFKKRDLNVTREDIVIDEEEGRLIGESFFGGHDVFKSSESYPFMRIQVHGPRFACKFLNVKNGLCTIYEIRPDMCRDYLCQFVKKNFLIRTKSHPNTYKCIDKELMK